MPINIIETVRFKYPNQIEMMNILFKQLDNSSDILISHWNVPNEPRPTEQEIIDFGLANEKNIELNEFKIKCMPLIDNLIESTAKSKLYSSALSCASYALSTNAQWILEAYAFIAWRDAVYSYGFSVISDIEGGGAIPTMEQLIAGLPIIAW